MTTARLNAEDVEAAATEACKSLSPGDERDRAASLASFARAARSYGEPMVMLSLDDWALIADAFYALKPQKPDPSRRG